MRNEGGGFAEIDDEVAAVLAFVISHTTFLAAQDDETGRCPKVVCKSLITRGSQSLISAFKLLAVTPEPISLLWDIACNYLKKEERKPSL